MVAAPPREVSLAVGIDSREEVIRVNENEHVATKCAKFCGKHRLSVDNCYLVYRELVRFLFELPEPRSRPSHDPPKDSAAYITSPRSQQYYPASQRIYFLLNLSSTTVEEKAHSDNVYDKFYDFHDYANQDFCVATDYTPGAAPAWCGKLPYEEPLYTQPNTFAPGVHMLHLLCNGEIVHSLFFQVSAPTLKLDVSKVLYLKDDGSEEGGPSSLTTVEVKIKVTTLGGFVPGIDGAVCFNVDGDSVCRYTEPLQSSGGPVVWNKTTGLSAVANSAKEVKGTTMMQVPLIGGERRFVSRANLTHVRKHCVYAVLMSYFYHSKALAMSSQLCFQVSHPFLKQGQRVLYDDADGVGGGSVSAGGKGGTIELHVGSAVDRLAGESSLFWLEDLGSHEWGLYSQNGEDGVLLSILRNLRLGHFAKGEGASVLGNRYYVEFGTEDGSECNSRLLRTAYGWGGLLMDGGNENLGINLHKEFITASNINDLFAKHGVPAEFDLLVVDIDFNDYWVWEQIGLSNHYRPRVVIVEYNGNIPIHEARVVTRADTHVWTDGSSYCGASLLAMAKLGVRLGYTLVYCESHGVNAFFVRNDVLGGALPGLGQVEQEDLDALLRVERIYRRANYFGKGWHYQPLDPDQMAREGKAWVWV
jgi:hypothetical protein